MIPPVLQTVADLRQHVRKWIDAGRSIGFVPTMGALHAGHAALIQAAVARGDATVVSVFVNPTQFDRSEDFEHYGRNLPADVTLARANGAGLIFAPTVEEMYPVPQQTWVEVTGITDHLCGATRPGHFRGVATVVLKLFHIVQPRRAYFGRKDAQQLAVIERMVRDLQLPVEIVPVATVREPDGLALSSRNQRLSPAERAAAPVLYRALQAAHSVVARQAGDIAAAKQAARDVLATEPLVRLEYFDIVDAAGMQPVAALNRPVCLAIAAWLGPTRLIDNLSFPADTAPA